MRRRLKKYNKRKRGLASDEKLEYYYPLLPVEEELFEVPFLMLPAASTASTDFAKAWRPSLLIPLEVIEVTCLSRAAKT